MAPQNGTWSSKNLRNKTIRPSLVLLVRPSSFVTSPFSIFFQSLDFSHPNTTGKACQLGKNGNSRCLINENNEPYCSITDTILVNYYLKTGIFLEWHEIFLHKLPKFCMTWLIFDNNFPLFSNVNATNYRNAIKIM